ncbi:hypothetical protein [Acetivibrio clariflavus]|uniref:hypothetical protein n=1 Tax=Acetivibrio clariflavus TaxID=288965 RepID=UPI0004864CE1|nr:hypothetical protein [Acetivibrio clariflavus]
MDLDNYSYLLDKERYVLIKLDENEYTIYDLLKKGVIIIETDSLFESIINMMLKNKNKVLKPSDIN